MPTKAAAARIACAAFVPFFLLFATPARACVMPIAYLHFAPGAAAVTDVHRSILEWLILAPTREIPAGRSRYTIDGHTDSAGAEDYNLALSQRRAEAVRDYLLTAGVAADAIAIAFHGESRPPFEAAGLDGNNRIVVVEFSNPDYPVRCP